MQPMTQVAVKARIPCAPPSMGPDGRVPPTIDPVALMESALDAHRAGRLDEAELQYCRVLEWLPEHPAATHFLGILRHQRGKSSEGVMLVRKSIDWVPELADWHNDLGNMLAAAEREDEAAEAFMAALEINPNNPVVWNNLGAVLQRAGQLEEATLSFENAIALDPGFEDALSNLGNALALLGRVEEAARSYCAAYVLRPDPAKPKQMLGIAYYTLGRIEEAAQTYRMWLQEEPGNPIAQHLLTASTKRDVPDRAADAYVETYFDQYVLTFDAKLVESLSYRVPEMAGQALRELAIPAGTLTVLDAGCGTGLCGPHLVQYSKHMVGVDLSAKSLAIAAGKTVYDELIKAELVEYLSTIGKTFDLIVAADTLIYFGSLDKVLRAAANALGGPGLIIASFEELVPSRGGFTINPSGRYSHSREYLVSSFTAAGFESHSITSIDVRTELGKPVKGLLFVARKRS